MKIAICGDCVIKAPSEHTIGPELQKLLDDCDVKGINFEAPVDIAIGKPIHKSGPVLSQSAQTPEWLERHGFNLITLANNHSLDYGEEGLQATIEAFNTPTLTGIGTYNTAYEVAIIKIGGETVGFLGLTHKEFGCVDCSTGNNLGTAMVTSPKVPVIISKIRSQVDRLYLLIHAGVEYTDAPLPEWRELYRSFIDLGADGVIASHPHVPQGWEIYNGCLIAYSLGNFAFEVTDNSISCEGWFNSYVAVVDTKDNSISMKFLKYDFISRCIDVDLSPKRVEQANYLNDLLASEIDYRKYLSSLYDSLEETYNLALQLGGAKPFSKFALLKNFAKPLFGKKRFRADAVHFLNLFQCESHRWMMMKYLDQNPIMHIKNNIMNFARFKPLRIYNGIRVRWWKKTRNFKRYADYLYLKEYGRHINWEYPEDLNQWINWLEFCTDTTQWSVLADKYAVRDYVKEKGFEDTLVPLLRTWDNAYDISFEGLPEKFVLKANNGCGDIRIVDRNSPTDIEEIRKYFAAVLNSKFGRDSAEPHYLRISPKIIAEELLDVTKQRVKSTSLVDYKFWCFNGHVEKCLVCSERTKQHCTLDLYDAKSWARIEDGNLNYDAVHRKALVPMPKPSQLNRMISIASELSKGFPQMRVDFYEIADKVYIGELTLSSACGRMIYFSDSCLKEMGLLCGEAVKTLKQYNND